MTLTDSILQGFSRDIYYNGSIYFCAHSVSIIQNYMYVEYTVFLPKSVNNIISPQEKFLKNPIHTFLLVCCRKKMLDSHKEKFPQKLLHLLFARYEGMCSINTLSHTCLGGDLEEKVLT